MLWLLRRRVDISGAHADLQAKLVRSAAFAIEMDGSDILLSRKRMLPNRGLFRLLVPRTRARLSLAGGPARYAIGLDGLAWLMSILLIAGVIIELTLDRVKYPRDYPPAFIYGLAAAYFVLIGVEVVMTDRAIRRALAGAA